MPIINTTFFVGLLTKLESLGGEIEHETANFDGSFVIGVNHPDVTINRVTGQDTVTIRCRRGLFPPTRAHVDVDDIMTVIEGWMKEAGGGCGKEAAPNKLPIEGDECPNCHSGTIVKEDGELRCAGECGKIWKTRAEVLRQKRERWGVDRPRTRPRLPRTKSMLDFIRENREQLDGIIRRHGQGNIGSLNDEERRLWILNDEDLYRWARSEGVRI